MNTAHSTLQPAIRECADAVALIAAHIQDEQLQGRTPCEKFTVAELVDHLGLTLQSAARAARKEAQPAAGAGSAVSPQDLADCASLAAVAWSEGAAYEGTTVFGPGEMPADFAASITLQELVLHGWDLARATGQSFGVSEDAGQVALGVVEQVAERARSNGSYGAPVPVPDDAPALHRALGASGRNPGWNG